MPRDTSALGGQETQAAQIPISLVQFTIPGFTTGTDIWGFTPQINNGGGYSAGATSIVVSKLGSGTIPAGAVFVLGGYAYKVTSSTVITSNAATLPVSPALVVAAANGDPLRTLALNLHDLDIPIYLNPSTNACSMQPGAGLVQFNPYADFSVPVIEETEDTILSDVTLALANENGDWYNVCAFNQYRDTITTIWQGNITLAAGVAPDAATFNGVAVRYRGRVDEIHATKRQATIKLAPHVTFFTMAWPYRRYTAPGFAHLPKAGAVIKAGFTEKVI